MPERTNNDRYYAHKEIVTVDLSDYINLKLEPLKVQYGKSEKLLESKAEELNKRIEATYVTIREVNDKLDKMDEARDEKLDKTTNRYYTTLAALILGMAIAFIYHIFGGG